jgi:hypothetical protein
MRGATLAVLLVAVSIPGAAVAAESGENKAAKPAKEKKICKQVDGQTSSRMRKRVCKTAAEWENHGSRTDVTDLERIGVK